jgi:hypothetical protein
MPPALSESSGPASGRGLSVSFVGFLLIVPYDQFRSSTGTMQEASETANCGEHDRGRRRFQSAEEPCGTNGCFIGSQKTLLAQSREVGEKIMKQDRVPIRRCWVQGTPNCALVFILSQWSRAPDPDRYRE